MDIAEIRKKYPQYSDLSDEVLLKGIHAKNYSDMPYEDFASKITIPDAAAPEPKQSLVQTLASGATAVGQGLLPFYDEIQSGVRAVADPSLYGDDRSIGERYDLSQEQIAEGSQKFSRENPKTNFGLTATAGLASPMNKLGAVTQGGAGFIQGAKNLGQNIARNASEASIYGYGAGEGDAFDRLESAGEAAQTAALFTGALDVGGRTFGSLLDSVKLGNPLRDPTTAPVKNQQGKVVSEPRIDPITMTNPSSVRGGIYRQGIARLPGANEALTEQSIPLLNATRARYGSQAADLKQQGTNLERLQRSTANDARLAGRERTQGLDKSIQAENLALQQAEDAARAAQFEGKAADAAQTAVRAESEAAADLANRQKLSRSALRESVPAGRREAVTESGEAGFTQALDEVNAAYKDAWGSSTDLAPGTTANVVSEARAAQDLLTEADAAKLGRVITNAEKLGEEAGSVAVLDEQLRELINASPDRIIKESLENVRGKLRAGLPEENLAKLNEVDAVYPNLLASQRAGYNAGLLEGGLPTVEQYAQAANVTAGQRRGSAGNQPLRETILAAQRPEVQVPLRAGVPPTPKAPSLTRTMDLQGRKQRVKNELEDEANILRDVQKDQRTAFKDTTEAELSPLKETLAKTEQNARLPNESLYMSYLLGSAVPGVPRIAGAGGVSFLGRKATSPSFQEFIAGQGKKTRQLADAIREGRTEYVTRGISRAAAIEEAKKANRKRKREEEN